MSSKSRALTGAESPVQWKDSSVRLALPLASGKLIPCGSLPKIARTKQFKTVLFMRAWKLRSRSGCVNASRTRRYHAHVQISESPNKLSKNLAT
jgi:hypothetical protein